jgi:hypothetical protein
VLEEKFNGVLDLGDRERLMPLRLPYVEETVLKSNEDVYPVLGVTRLAVVPDGLDVSISLGKGEAKPLKIRPRQLKEW